MAFHQKAGRSQVDSFWSWLISLKRFLRWSHYICESDEIRVRIGCRMMWGAVHVGTVAGPPNNLPESQTTSHSELPGSVLSSVLCSKRGQQCQPYATFHSHPGKTSLGLCFSYSGRSCRRPRLFVRRPRVPILRKTFWDLASQGMVKAVWSIHASCRSRPASKSQ